MKLHRLKKSAEIGRILTKIEKDTIKKATRLSFKLKSITNLRNKKMNSKCEKEVLGIEGGSKSENDLKRRHHNNIRLETGMSKMYKIKLCRMSKLPLKGVKWNDLRTNIRALI